MVLCSQMTKSTDSVTKGVSDLIGLYDKYSEYDPFWGDMENTEFITFHDDGNESFTSAFFETDFVSETLDSLIENGFDSGKDFFPSLEKYLNSFCFIINDYNSNTTKLYCPRA